MTIETDPIDYAEVDKNNANSSALPLAESINGFADGEFYEAPDHNALMRNAARWKRWLDQTRIDHRQLGLSSTFRSSVNYFSYGVGAGLGPRAVTGDSHLVVGGYYVALTIARLTYYQPTIKDYTFTANMTHHFYVAQDGTVTASVVALGTPAAPPVGTVTLLSVDTNGTGITTETIGTSFLTQSIQLSNPLDLLAALTVESSLTVTGGNLTLDKPDALARRLAFTVAGGSGPDTTRGWQLEHSATERLVFRELLPPGGGGSATTILDLGASGTPTIPISTTRPVSISSAETLTGIAALTVNSTNFQGPGSTMTTDRTASLTLNATGTGGVPLVLVPRAPDFVGGAVVGSIEIGNDAASHLQFKDNNGATRIAWATKIGQLLADTYSATAVNNFAGATAFSVNVAFVAGQRYRVRMGVRVGRAAGSTRDANILCTVGGANLAFTNQTVTLFQAGGAGQLEVGWSDEAIFTAGATGTLAVQLLVTPVNGAGNLNMNYRGVMVAGHYD